MHVYAKYKREWTPQAIWTLLHKFSKLGGTLLIDWLQHKKQMWRSFSNFGKFYFIYNVILGCIQRVRVLRYVVNASGCSLDLWGHPFIAHLVIPRFICANLNITWVCWIELGLDVFDVVHKYGKVIYVRCGFDCIW